MRSRSGRRWSPGEDDAQELPGVEVVAGEDAQLVEDGGERFLGLVDDQDGPHECGLNVLAPALAQGLESGPAVVTGERYPEEIGELAVEVHRAALRVLHGADGDVRQLLQALAEKAQRDALARAGVAGDHDEAAIGDADFHTAYERVEPAA